MADISENNPNVWYEVGFADGQNVPIVLVCEKQKREGLPFDMNQRPVYFYDLTSSGGQEKLKTEIVRRIKTDIANTEDRLPKSEAAGKEIVDNSIELGSCEIEVLKEVLYTPHRMIGKRDLLTALDRYSEVEVNLSLEKLLTNNFISRKSAFPHDTGFFFPQIIIPEIFPIKLEEKGRLWCDGNPDLLGLD